MCRNTWDMRKNITLPLRITDWISQLVFILIRNVLETHITSVNNTLNYVKPVGVSITFNDSPSLTAAEYII